MGDAVGIVDATVHVCLILKYSLKRPGFSYVLMVKVLIVSTCACSEKQVVSLLRRKVILWSRCTI